MVDAVHIRVVVAELRRYVEQILTHSLIVLEVAVEDVDQLLHSDDLILEHGVFDAYDGVCKVGCSSTEYSGAGMLRAALLDGHALIDAAVHRQRGVHCRKASGLFNLNDSRCFNHSLVDVYDLLFASLNDVFLAGKFTRISGVDSQLHAGPWVHASVQDQLQALGVVDIAYVREAVRAAAAILRLGASYNVPAQNLFVRAAL